MKPERPSGSNEQGEARPGEAVFKFTDFPDAEAELRNSPPDYNLPGGASERIKRGKEKVVTRAVACAEMKPCGVSERWLHGTDELEESSLVQQFLNNILWRV